LGIHVPIAPLEQVVELLQLGGNKIFNDFSHDWRLAFGVGSQCRPSFKYTHA
jgi:hypothetical protein